MNHATSQKLIDVRRKMKDKKATDFAMMVNHESWKLGSATNPYQLHRTPIQPKAKPTTSLSVPRTLPIQHHNTPGARKAPYTYPRPPHLGPPMMGSIAYSPFGGNPVTQSCEEICLPVDASSLVAHATTSNPITSPVNETDNKGEKRLSQEITPSVTKVTRLLAHRVCFDVSSSRKKRRKGDVGEVLFHFFGEKLPMQSETIALSIFSFLSNEETYYASLVCKSWNKLAMNEDLWKFA
jgi:F-box-like